MTREESIQNETQPNTAPLVLGQIPADYRPHPVDDIWGDYICLFHMWSDDPFLYIKRLLKMIKDGHLEVSKLIKMRIEREPIKHCASDEDEIEFVQFLISQFKAGIAAEGLEP